MDAEQQFQSGIALSFTSSSWHMVSTERIMFDDDAPDCEEQPG
jgi:hypothetical protein